MFNYYFRLFISSVKSCSYTVGAACLFLWIVFTSLAPVFYLYTIYKTYQYLCQLLYTPHNLNYQIRIRAMHILHRPYEDNYI